MSFINRNGRGLGGNAGRYEEERDRLQAYSDAKTLEHEEDGTVGQHHAVRRMMRRVRRALRPEPRD